MTDGMKRGIFLSLAKGLGEEPSFIYDHLTITIVKALQQYQLAIKMSCIYYDHSYIALLFKRTNSDISILLNEKQSQKLMPPCMKTRVEPPTDLEYSLSYFLKKNHTLLVYKLGFTLNRGPEIRLIIIYFYFNKGTFLPPRKQAIQNSPCMYTGYYFTCFH